MEAPHIFRATDLLPEAWRSLLAEGPVRTFNPGLLRDGDGWLFAFRVSGSAPWRRIGICRLDAALRVVPGSAVALSDFVRFRADHAYPEIVPRWFADPRLYRLGGCILVYWNSGWHEPQNHQFIQELDATTLQPLGVARELLLAGERQKLEKNWTLFESPGGALHAIYSATPQRVLAFSLAGDGDLTLHDATTTPWRLSAYPACHGGLRGGAPPQEAGGRFWSFCHTVHDAPEGYRYHAAAYQFAPAFPFAPLAEPIAPLRLPNPWGAGREFPRLNPAVSEVIYPCGAARDGEGWLVSYGINDEQCALVRIGDADVNATLRDCSCAP